jgi:hypothetical protein
MLGSRLKSDLGFLLWELVEVGKTLESHSQTNTSLVVVSFLVDRAFCFLTTLIVAMFRAAGVRIVTLVGEVVNIVPGLCMCCV